MTIKKTYREILMPQRQKNIEIFFYTLKPKLKKAEL